MDVSFLVLRYLFKFSILVSFMTRVLLSQGESLCFLLSVTPQIDQGWLIYTCSLW